MKDHPRSGALGVWSLLGLALLYFIARHFFPSLSTLLLVLAAVVAFGIVALVALVVVFAFRKPKQRGEPAGSGQSTVLQQGRADLLTLRGLLLRVKDGQVRALGETVCREIEQILRVLKERPEDIPLVRQLFPFYLPALIDILRQLIRLEQSGVSDSELTEKVITCLRDMQAVLEKLHAGLLSNGKLELAAEMEALAQFCRREGLLADSAHPAEGGGSDITPSP